MGADQSRFDPDGHEDDERSVSSNDRPASSINSPRILSHSPLSHRMGERAHSPTLSHRSLSSRTLSYDSWSSAGSDMTKAGLSRAMVDDAKWVQGRRKSATSSCRGSCSERRSGAQRWNEGGRVRWRRAGSQPASIRRGSRYGRRPCSAIDRHPSCSRTYIYGSLGGFRVSHECPALTIFFVPYLFSLLAQLRAAAYGNCALRRFARLT